MPVKVRTRRRPLITLVSAQSREEAALEPARGQGGAGPGGKGLRTALSRCRGGEGCSVAEPGNYPFRIAREKREQRALAAERERRAGERED